MKKAKSKKKRREEKSKEKIKIDDKLINKKNRKIKKRKKKKEILSTQKRKKLRQRYQKKIKLAKQRRRTKWAPFWAVLKKYGMGKRVHPSRMTRVRRNWRQTKLKIKPRRTNKRYIG